MLKGRVRLGLLVLAAAWGCGGVAHAAGLTALVADNNDSNFGSLTPVSIVANEVEPWGGLGFGGPNPMAIAFTPNGSSAWVASEVSTSAKGFLEQVLLESHKSIVESSSIYDPWGIAISPDGATAYVVNEGSGIVPVTLETGAVGAEIEVEKAYAIAIAPDGETAYVLSSFGYEDGWVTPVVLATGKPAGSAIPVGDDPVAIAITPDGSAAYVVNSGEGTVTPIDLHDDTAETAIKLPETIYAAGIAIAPDGLSAYVGAQESSARSNADVIEPIDLADKTVGAPISVGQDDYPPTDVAIGPDGATAYVTDTDGDLIPVDLSEEKAGTPIDVKGSYAEAGPVAVAIQPDQAPVAAFSTTPAPPGEATKFDASASTASFGSIASYAWEFGDGDTETTSTPETTHVYTEARTYEAKLTVTDSWGTSTGKVYTGQMMLRNGGPSAKAEHSVVISAGGSPQPEVELSELSLAFGDVEVGHTDGPKTITVKNSGSGELEIEAGGVRLAGEDLGAFELGEDRCSGEDIAPGDECTFAVSFAPSAPSTARASVEIEDNATGSPQQVTLTGTGTAASAQLSSTSLEFGQIATGTTSAAQRVTLSNGGSAPLTLLGPEAVTLAGAQPGAFKLSEDECSGRTLLPAESCTVAVAFAPSEAGSSYTATLVFTDNAPNSPQTLALSGSTPAPPPPANVSASPNSLQFFTGVGTTGASQNVLVSNTGGTAAHVSGVTLGGANPGAFKIIADDCIGQELGPLDSLPCTIAVAFAPPGAGDYSAKLLIDDDASGSPLPVALSGATTTGTITGTVTDASDGNAPVAGAAVEGWLVSATTGRLGEPQMISTGANGSYVLSGLTPGVWHLAVFAPAHLSGAAALVNVSATAGTVANFDLHAPQPLSGGVSFDGPNGEVESGVPTVYFYRPFSFKMPVHIGPGEPNTTNAFLVTTALGNAGAAGGEGGGFNLASAALFSVHYDASGRPTEMSQITVGQLECGPPAQPSPCGAFGTASADAGVHATAARVTAGASLLQGGLGLVQDGFAQGGLAVAHAAACGGPPGFRNGTAFGFEVSPTSNGGIQIEMSVVPFQPPVKFIFDPFGIAPPAPTGNPMQNSVAEQGVNTVNKLLGSAIPGLGTYNTLVKVLSSGLTAIENPTAGNVINAFLQTTVSQLNVEDHGALYYFGSTLKGPLGKVLKEKSEGTVPGNTEGGFTGPGPGAPCEEQGSGGGGGAGGGGGGSGSENGSETLGGEAYLDPSGLVQSSGHAPVAGATVTLTRSASATGRQIRVANGSALMSPGNRRNPDLTSLLGEFGWDVQPGYYQIDARRSGCRGAHGGTVSRSPVKPVPPPQSDLVLTLKCPKLRRTATHLRLKLTRGIDGTSVLRVTVGSSRRLRSKTGDYVGTIVVRNAGRVLANTVADPRTGLAVVDLPPLAASSHSVTVSFAGNGLLSPSSAGVWVPKTR